MPNVLAAALAAGVVFPAVDRRDLGKLRESLC